MAETTIKLEGAALKAFGKGGIARATLKAMRKAASTSARDMKSEASRRIRGRKRLKVKAVNKALRVRKNHGRTMDGMAWGLDIRGGTVRLGDYPARQLKRGVKVEVNKGKKTLIKSAFIATLKSGHKGVFVRKGKARLPIGQLLGSRPVDALMHDGEADGVIERGRSAFAKTFDRVLPMELEKLK